MLRPSRACELCSLRPRHTYDRRAAERQTPLCNATSPRFGATNLRRALCCRGKSLCTKPARVRRRSLRPICERRLLWMAILPSPWITLLCEGPRLCETVRRVSRRCAALQRPSSRCADSSTRTSARRRSKSRHASTLPGQRALSTPCNGPTYCCRCGTCMASMSSLTSLIRACSGLTSSRLNCQNRTLWRPTRVSSRTLRERSSAPHYKAVRRTASAASGAYVRGDR